MKKGRFFFLLYFFLFYRVYIFIYNYRDVYKMILSYIYLIRTGHQTIRPAQCATEAAKHHYKRSKGARGKGGSAEGGGLFKAIESGRGSKQAERRDGAGGLGRGRWTLCARAARGLPYGRIIYIMHPRRPLLSKPRSDFQGGKIAMHLFPLPYSKFVLYQTSPIRAGLFLCLWLWGRG